MNCERVCVRSMVLVLTLGLGGCATVGTPDTKAPPAVKQPQQAPAPPPPTTPQPPARPPQPSTSSAWQPLVQKAEAAADRGDYDEALGLLERAQRIDPGSATIYLQLARVHQARGDRAQARTTAERGLLYCTSNLECDALRAYSR